MVTSKDKQCNISKLVDKKINPFEKGGNYFQNFEYHFEQIKFDEL